MSPHALTPVPFCPHPPYTSGFHNISSMPSSDNEDVQPKPSDRDTTIPDSKSTPPPLDKPGDKVSQEQVTSPVFKRGGVGSDREARPASAAAAAAPKTGTDVGGDGVSTDAVAVEMSASAGEPLANGERAEGRRKGGATRQQVRCCKSVLRWNWYDRRSRRVPRFRP